MNSRILVQKKSIYLFLDENYGLLIL